MAAAIACIGILSAGIALLWASIQVIKFVVNIIF